MAKKSSETVETEKSIIMAGEFPVFCSYDAIIDIEKAIPNPKNPNTHPERQIELLSRIIRGQGWRQPITISKRSGFIIRGHARLAAARILNTTKVPVEYQNYASEAAEHADMIADNKIAELAHVDKKTLKSLVEEIKGKNFDVSLTGIDSEELMELLKNDPKVTEKEPETAKKVRTKKGDIWELGKHRLICGDSTDPETIKKLMDGKKAHLLFTDPPYGVNYQADKKEKKIKGDNLKDNNLKDNNLINKLLLPALKQAVLNTKDDAAFFVWHASVNKSEFDYAIKAAGLEEKQMIIWIKPTFTLGRADYHWKHEPCIYAQKCGFKAKYTGDRAQSTVWEIQALGSNKGEFAIANGIRLSMESGMEMFIKKQPPKNNKSRLIRLKQGQKVLLTYDDSNTDTWAVSQDNKSSYIHPTQKPVELAERALKNHTNPGEIVLDLFSGSGSTLIAAERIERICRASELDERYCDLTVVRYVQHCKVNEQKYQVKLNGKDVTEDYKNVEV